MITKISIATTRRDQFVEITRDVERVVRESGVREGIAVLQSLHTTAGLTINENADPDVQLDMVAKLRELVPEDEPSYRHAEGNSDSHVKTSLFGPSLSVIIAEGRLLLGRWQGIYFCEWDGPRQREVAIRVMEDG